MKEVESVNLISSLSTFKINISVSLSTSVCLHVYLSICLSVYTRVRFCRCLLSLYVQYICTIHIYVFLFIILYIYLSIHLSIVPVEESEGIILSIPENSSIYVSVFSLIDASDEYICKYLDRQEQTISRQTYR